MVKFGQAWPKLMEIAVDKVVKSMDRPGADEIAKRIKRTIPPELTQEGEEQATIPPEVQMQMDQLGQYVEMLHGQLQQAQAALADKDKDRDLERYKTDVDASVKLAVEEMKQQMAPLQDLGVRIQQIEAALGNIADVLVPAVETTTGPLEGMTQ